VTSATRERLAAIVGEERVQQNAPLAPLTTFRVGGAADWLVEVRSSDELRAVVASTRDARLPLTVLGGGSNLLVSDAGVRGIVVRLRGGEIRQVSRDGVRADAAVTINGLVRWTLSHNLGGLELWAGTPGTVGGAIYGNAHFRGRLIGDLVTRAAVLSRDAGVLELDRADMEFGYDASRLQRTGEILLWAQFLVHPADAARLRETARGSLAYRKHTQPLNLPSAGCIFQNPDPATARLPPGAPASAGALIDRAGLKGRRIGGAQVSPTHGNFIVNDRNASAAEIRELIEECKAVVRDRFGVALKEEIVYLGEF
jgi:UDP-N-acetylmuramate dehydrogenase